MDSSYVMNYTSYCFRMEYSGIHVHGIMLCLESEVHSGMHVLNSVTDDLLLTFSVNDGYGASNIHLGIDLLGGKIT